MINRCYLEITNCCNLDCSFCPKHHRAAHSLTMAEFDELTNRLIGEVKFLYMHLMGEPFLHRHLPDFVRMARAKGFVPILTTNGTLLHRPEAIEVLDAAPFKVQISLHSLEGNEGNGTRSQEPGARNREQEEYIRQVVEFAKEGAQRGVISVLRLWNIGGRESENEAIVQQLAQLLPQPWEENRNGYRLADHIYLEYDHAFEWPDRDKATEYEQQIFCYGLRNQVGILVDGTVVPCCLDHEGDIPLGNLYRTPLGEILATPRARAIYNGFSRHEAVEPLCRRCGYAAETKRFALKKE